MCNELTYPKGPTESDDLLLRILWRQARFHGTSSFEHCAYIHWAILSLKDVYYRL